MKEIQLTQGKVALVDDDMYEYLMQWKWFANKKGSTFYAVRSLHSNNVRKTIFMHRLITNNIKIRTKIIITIIKN